MQKITNDFECIKIIERILSYDFSGEDESSDLLYMLEDYMTGLADIITQEKTLPSPVEILRMARERNKPILL